MVVCLPAVGGTKNTVLSSKRKKKNHPTKDPGKAIRVEPRHSQGSRSRPRPRVMSNKPSNCYNLCCRTQASLARGTPAVCTSATVQ